MMLATLAKLLPLTRGVLDPHRYYYRRLVTDAVQAVELPGVDADRLAVVGIYSCGAYLSRDHGRPGPVASGRSLRYSPGPRAGPGRPEGTEDAVE
jgi:hypothetical protein